MASVLVIGAGIGGIATAARLARHGYQVTVLEKGERAGGRCNRLVKDGHSFDTGPTLFLMPRIYAQTFADVGERMEDHLDLQRVDPSYRVHFADESTLVLTSDLHAMRAQLEAIEPGSFGAFLRYLSEGHRSYTLGLPHLAERSFHNLRDFFSFLLRVPLFGTKLLTTHHDNIGQYFNDDRLKPAFTFQDMYLSLSPFEAPAIYSLLQYAEFSGGVWLPMGGMYRVVEALVGIAEKWGARFIYQAPVKQINVVSQQATGVTLADGRQIESDIVVANADLPYVYRSLLPDDGMAERLDRKEYTCSTLMFHWGVDKQYPQFGSHNLFVPANYRHTLDRILKDLTLPEELTFYIHTPVHIDPSMAPEGQDTLIVIVPVGHINDAAPQDWPAIQKQARRLVLQRLARIGVHDLEEHMKFEVSYTPSDWLSRYNLTKGSTLGLAHNLMQMGLFRPRNRHARYRNLYFVGASTHPGSGVPTVLLSARFAAERILQDAGVPRVASTMARATTSQSSTY
jgi:phytoene desaturase